MDLFLFTSVLCLGLTSGACLMAEDLIKRNEGPVNFYPGDSRTVCWGSNSEDLRIYLGFDYDEYAKNGWYLSEEECSTLFNSKLADAIQAADILFGHGMPSCPCARAAAVDVIYDVSPQIAQYAP